MVISAFLTWSGETNCFCNLNLFIIKLGEPDKRKTSDWKNVNDLPSSCSEALEINNWTIVCPLNSTHKVGRTTRNKNDPVIQCLHKYFITILGCTYNLAALACIHLHMFACQGYILTIVMFLLLLSLSNTLFYIMHFYHYQFVDNISTDIYAWLCESIFEIIAKVIASRTQQFASSN